MKFRVDWYTVVGLGGRIESISWDIATADVSSCQGGMFPITFAKAGTANIVHFTIAYDLLKNGSWTICLSEMVCICLNEMEIPNVWFLAWMMSHKARGVHVIVMGVGSLLH